MQQLSFVRSFFSKKSNHAWTISGIALIIALFLTLISHFHLCSQACAEGHNWTLFGLPFEISGIAFFTTLLLVHGLSKNESFYATAEQWLLASALGAEIFFIYIQKVKIGQWCPVCLGIALCIAIAFLISFWLSPPSKNAIQKNTLSQIPYISGDLMKNTLKTLPIFSALLIGFIFAFLGVDKANPLHAAELKLKENLAFGNKNSSLEAYLFTDWACPACRKLEENLDSLMQALLPQTQFFFIDHVIHPETLNFVPYNLSFLINNKTQYLKLRH